MSCKRRNRLLQGSVAGKRHAGPYGYGWYWLRMMMNKVVLTVVMVMVMMMLMMMTMTMTRLWFCRQHSHVVAK